MNSGESNTHDAAPHLARLERVDLRHAWKGEATDFTPWLATPENITLLGESISLELEVDSQEKDVGPYRADILCRDTVTNQYVLVENQLEKTDHTHLGQLLTYAAGLDAVTIVWVARQFTDEHRAALDWLNDSTGAKLNFFGLEIELWKIGDSPMAPKFNVVSSPNDWSAAVQEQAAAAQSGTLVISSDSTSSTGQRSANTWMSAAAQSVPTERRRTTGAMSPSVGRGFLWFRGMACETTAPVCI